MPFVYVIFKSCKQVSVEYAILSLVDIFFCAAVCSLAVNFK